MNIKRLELNIQCGDTILSVFHTGADELGGDPPTIITEDGYEFEGQVFMTKNNNEYNIRIIKL